MKVKMVKLSVVLGPTPDDPQRPYDVTLMVDSARDLDTISVALSPHLGEVDPMPGLVRCRAEDLDLGEFPCGHADLVLGPWVGFGEEGHWPLCRAAWVTPAAWAWTSDHSRLRPDPHLPEGGPWRYHGQLASMDLRELSGLITRLGGTVEYPSWVLAPAKAVSHKVM